MNLPAYTHRTLFYGRIERYSNKIILIDNFKPPFQLRFFLLKKNYFTIPGKGNFFSELKKSYENYLWKILLLINMISSR